MCGLDSCLIGVVKLKKKISDITMWIRLMSYWCRKIEKEDTRRLKKNYLTHIPVSLK